MEWIRKFLMGFVFWGPIGSLVGIVTLNPAMLFGGIVAMWIGGIAYLASKREAPVRTITRRFP